MRISDWSSDVCSSDLLVDAIVETDDRIVRQSVADLLHDVRRKDREAPVPGQPGGVIQFRLTIAQHRAGIPLRRWRDRFLDLPDGIGNIADHRSEEHTSELQSLMRISYAVFCLKKKKYTQPTEHNQCLTIRPQYKQKQQGHPKQPILPTDHD